MLCNIREAKRHLVLHCKYGKSSVTKKGDLNGYDTLWYHLTGIANNLFLKNFWRKYGATFDSNMEYQGL